MVAKITSSQMPLSSLSRIISANDSANNASPMLTSSHVGWRSARRPTSAMVMASTMPAGSMIVPTCEAESCSPSCIYTGSR